jgi:alpha-mannosidase
MLQATTPPTRGVSAMLTDRILFERVEKWLSPLYWSDINIHSVLYHKQIHIPLTNLEVYEPNGFEQPNIQTIIQQQFELFHPTSIGTDFTPSWSTKWFKFQIQFPEDFNPTDQTIALLWDSNSEAILYHCSGRQIQAFTGGGGGDRRDLCIFNKEDLQDPKDLMQEFNTASFFVEMACNGMFGNGQDGMIHPPNPNKSFTLSDARIVLLNTDAYALYWDLTVMCDMFKSLPATSPTSRQLLRLMNEIMNKTNLQDSSSLGAAHHLALNFFQDGCTSKVNHDLYAFGHCHIDTAWLWPYLETRRKVARSWATQLHLLKSYPEYRFVASQTVQFEWLLEDHPQLFARVKEAVHEGSFIPVGGTYVEFDANLPSGESMVRQFLYGRKFLKSHFEIVPKIFWLPDTFGYSSQLPQIMKGFGMDFFLSQKLSWNLINT